MHEVRRRGRGDLESPRVPPLLPPRVERRKPEGEGQVHPVRRGDECPQPSAVPEPRRPDPERRVTTELRPYQDAAFAALRERMAANVRRLLLVAPTGAGKGTLLAFMIARSVARGKRVLFIVAGRQLVDEFSQRLERQYAVQHGVVMAGHWRRNATWPVQVASVDTLASMLRRGEQLPPADLVILDEADLARADRFERPLAAYPDAFVIGVTATPVRADGKGLGALFDDLIVAATPRELIAQGFLSDYDGLVFESALDAETLRAAGRSDRAAEEAYQQLSAAKREMLNGDIVEKWHSFAAGRRTVGFAMTREHSRQIVERFNAERHHGAPIAKAEHVDGTMAWDVRQGIVGRIRSGESQIVSNVGILGRGVDIPSLEVCAFWRPTASLALFLQQAGRVLRTSPETGKRDALYLDHVGNVARHGLPDDDRQWSLADGIVPQEGDEQKATPLRECKKCRAVYMARKLACPRCGAVPEVKAQQTEIVEVADVKATPMRQARGHGYDPREDVREARRLEWFMKQAIAHGRKPRWAGHVFAGKDQSRMPSDAVLAKVAAQLGHEFTDGAWRPLKRSAA
jgi:DNA repair protein RadD